MLNLNLIKKKYILYLNIILFIALIISALLLVHDITALSSKQKYLIKRDTSLLRSSSSDNRKTYIDEYSPIMKNNPFGFPAGEIYLLSSSSQTLVQNSVTDITLIGTVVGPPEMSYALFQDSSGKQEVFRRGESVLGIGILYAVKNDRVIIKQDNNIMEVHLKDITEIESEKTLTKESRFTSGFARRIGKDMYLVDQRKVQEAIENPTQIMTDARLTPNIRNGKKEGFILTEVKPGGIYYSLGLRNGDVLLRINEYDISNPETALQAFTALKGLDRIQIDLIRNGTKMTMTYQIK